MSKKDIEQKRVLISNPPQPNSSIKQVDDVFIVVTQAFCPNGHNLINSKNEHFDGHPGIKLKLVTSNKASEIFLSPFHGDHSKKGDTDWSDGEKFDIRCPICDTSLPTLAKCHCGDDSTPRGELVKLYISPELKDSHILALCNIWGCRKSHTIDNWNIISEYLDGQISD